MAPNPGSGGDEDGDARGRNGDQNTRMLAPEFDGWSAQAKPSDIDATYTRKFVWSYRGNRFAWELEIPISIYEYCANRLRTSRYGLYIADPFQKSFIQSLTDRFVEHCGDESIDRELIHIATRFVQSLEYSLDIDNTGHEIYPKYPIQTLVHKQGDCEDGTLLLGAILHEMGYDVAVLALPDARHMVLGVADDALSGANVELDGESYYVIETTKIGWDPGEFPPQYANANVQPHKPESLPVLIHEWTATPIGSNEVEVIVHVTNWGDAPAENMKVQIEFERRNGETALRAPLVADSETLNPTDFTKYERIVRLRPERALKGRCQLILGRQLHDSSESDWQ